MTMRILALTFAAAHLLGSAGVAQSPLTKRVAELDARVRTLDTRARTLSTRLSAMGPSLWEIGEIGEIAAAFSGLGLEIASSVLAEVLREVPEGWDTQDPADATWRDARAELNRGNNTRAAELFARIYGRYPRSSYAADSYYWEAYARYRAGSTSNLNAALDALKIQADRFPDARTRGDADALAARIRGQLAQRGDADAAREVRTRAEQLAREDQDARRDQRESSRERADSRRDHAQQGRGRGSCRDDDDERIAALNALLNMDADRALPLLERVMGRRDEGSICLRRRAVFMISQHQNAKAESMLLDAVRSDPDQEVRENAVFWLSQVDNEHAATALDSILEASTDGAVQEKAIFALSQQSSPRAAQALRDYAARASAPVSLREKAIFWLGQNGRGESSAFLRSLYGSVREDALKEKIIFSLAQQDNADAGRWLLEIAANANESVKLRKNAIFWAAQGGADLPGLFALYDRADDREIREQLIFAYSQTDRREAVDKLIEIARNDGDRELRKKALFWLSQSDDPRVAKFLEELLDRP